VYCKQSRGFVAKYEKEGFGQERISFCQIKPPETANNINLIKFITSQTLEPVSTSDADDSDSDEPHSKVKQFEYFCFVLCILIFRSINDLF